MMMDNNSIYARRESIHHELIYVYILREKPGGVLERYTKRGKSFSHTCNHFFYLWKIANFGTSIDRRWTKQFIVFKYLTVNFQKTSTFTVSQSKRMTTVVNFLRYFLFYFLFSFDEFSLNSQWGSGKFDIKSNMSFAVFLHRKDVKSTKL